MDILDLIPQRPPMVLIDRLTECEGMKAKGMLELRTENVFLIGNKFSESGMIEALAQTAAARTGWLMRAGEEEKGRKGEKELERKPVPVGVIGSIKDFRLFFYPGTGDELTTEVEVKHEFMNASVIQGKVRVKDKVACELEMKIFLTSENVDQP